MRIKSHWFREDRPKSPAEIAGAAAFIISRVAQNSMKTMRAANYDLPPGPQYFAFVDRIPGLPDARRRPHRAPPRRRGVARRVHDGDRQPRRGDPRRERVRPRSAPRPRPRSSAGSSRWSTPCAAECAGLRLDRGRPRLRVPALARPSRRRGDDRARPDAGRSRRSSRSRRPTPPPTCTAAWPACSIRRRAGAERRARAAGE